MKRQGEGGNGKNMLMKTKRRSSPPLSSKKEEVKKRKKEKHHARLTREKEKKIIGKEKRSRRNIDWNFKEEKASPLWPQRKDEKEKRKYQYICGKKNSVSSSRRKNGLPNNKIQPVHENLSKEWLVLVKVRKNAEGGIEGERKGGHKHLADVARHTDILDSGGERVHEGKEEFYPSRWRLGVEVGWMRNFNGVPERTTEIVKRPRIVHFSNDADWIVSFPSRGQAQLLLGVSQV